VLVAWLSVQCVAMAASSLLGASGIRNVSAASLALMAGVYVAAAGAMLRPDPPPVEPTGKGRQAIEALDKMLEEITAWKPRCALRIGA
jgi:hypothetical protein